MDAENKLIIHNFWWKTSNVYICIKQSFWHNFYPNDDFIELIETSLPDNMHVYAARYRVKYHSYLLIKCY